MKKKIKLVSPCALLMAAVLLLFMKFQIGVILIGLMLIFEIGRYMILRKAPLDIKTPDGFNQPYHPSAIFFENGWHGYKYWLAYTPFPIGAKPYRDRWEYPCITVSNDGITWTTQNTNSPLDDLSDYQIDIKAYFSDTHLVYNSAEDQIELYYRLSEGNHVQLLRKISKDGIHWSDREYIHSPVDYPVISPAIELDNNTYKMWYVKEANHQMSVHYAYSLDGVNWDYGFECKLDGASVNPWHLDCKKYDGSYYLLTYDFSHKLMLWKSEDGVNFDYEKTILTANAIPGSFYRLTLYRSCMLHANNEYVVYFSAGNEREVKIGLMKGEDLLGLTVESGTAKYNWKAFFQDLIDVYFLPFRWIGWKLCSQKK